jgi:hypothetical protein
MAQGEDEQVPGMCCGTATEHVESPTIVRRLADVPHRREPVKSFGYHRSA